tara:strand:- start:12480 stop:13535 length:1056 start_codon:yes stop_codon:yes gene_type:complete
MAGILDKKVKLIDLVVTEEGRRQMAQGGFTPSFASFTDRNTFYDKNHTSAQESTGSLFFQTPSYLPDDQIVFETDDSGRIVGGTLSEEFTVVGDQLFAKDPAVTNVKSFTAASGSQYSSTIKLFRSKAINAFKRNKIVRTVSGLQDQYDKFELSADNHTFTISNSVPFPRGPLTAHINLDNAETFMFDCKLAHNSNFQYLPPVNQDGSFYGRYQDFRSTTKSTFEDIKRYLGVSVLERFDSLQVDNTVFNYDGDVQIKNRAPNLPVDTIISREYASVYFKKTSEQNNVILQVFEEDDESGTVTKLDVVDAGVFHDEIDPDRIEKHVFYVGKIFFDSFNTPTFVNMFTIIFD